MGKEFQKGASHPATGQARKGNSLQIAGGIVDYYQQVPAPSRGPGVGPDEVHGYSVKGHTHDGQGLKGDPQGRGFIGSLADGA